MSGTPQQQQRMGYATSTGDPTPVTDPQVAYHPSPTGYPQQVAPAYLPEQPPPQVTITSPVTFAFGEVPQPIQCPHCHASVTTVTRYENGTLTWVAAGLLCLFGCWCGCCLIPLFVNGCKDVIHSCPSCKHVVGKYNRI